MWVSLLQYIFVSLHFLVIVTFVIVFFITMSLYGFIQLFLVRYLKDKLAKIKLHLIKCIYYSIFEKNYIKNWRHVFHENV